jgi:uncharacterized tellurite resistance protein B-like protein
LSGETLYISLALARIFTKDEVKAVIGHELGHFRGKDTYYSLKFSPVYAGLSHAVFAMQGQDRNSGAGSIATLPALVVLNYMIEVFHSNVSTISRDREYEADKAAAEISAPINLATALLKLSLYADAWNDLQHRVIDRLAERKGTVNLSRLFSSIVRFDVNRESIPEFIGSIGDKAVTHPTDSHPPTATRIESVGVDIGAIDQNLLLAPHESSIDLFENANSIEEELTELQQQYYVAIGAVVVPDEGGGEFAATLIAAFGAHMILADGHIDDAEIDGAESIGLSLTKRFDNIDLREYCHYPESLPSVDDLLEASAELPTEAKQLIIDYLKKISEADSDVSAEEVALLQRVSNSFAS